REWEKGKGMGGGVSGWRAEELQKRDWRGKIKGRNHRVFPSRHFESDALAVQHLGFGSGSLHLVRGRPMRGSHERIPSCKRNLRFWVFAPKCHKCVSGNHPHGRISSVFPMWEQDAMRRAEAIATFNARDFAGVIDEFVIE